MKNEKECYIQERTFGEHHKIDLKVLDYWKKTLVGVDSSIFSKMYDASLEKILFSDTVEVYDTIDIKKLNDLEEKFQGWKSQYNREKVEKNTYMYFEPFYTLFINFALDILKNRIMDLSDEIIRSFKDAVLEKIGHISLRVLIQELHICKECELLHGDAKEQYKEYCETYLADVEYIEELFQIYPVMKRLVFESIMLLTDRYQEFVLRFRKDVSMIKEKFLLSEEELHMTYLRSDTSDSHNKGETAFIQNYQFI